MVGGWIFWGVALTKTLKFGSFLQIWRSFATRKASVTGEQSVTGFQGLVGQRVTTRMCGYRLGRALLQVGNIEIKTGRIGATINFQNLACEEGSGG